MEAFTHGMLEYINVNRDFQIYFQNEFPGWGFDTVCRTEMEQRTFSFVKHVGCDTNTTRAYKGLLGFYKTIQLCDSFRSY